ncbi:hypothetical protein EJB05_15855 [Eragrostis curvula]|uniref:Uncharacterized protein n=1 Tax=Eragrostis curvula TaxID=38414 RepID=A0A5J9VDB4_9POAL|nr:hypothetical protein EJB05_15855 [Eragrostis curvula]
MANRAAVTSPIDSSSTLPPSAVLCILTVELLFLGMSFHFLLNTGPKNVKVRLPRCFPVSLA